MKTSQRQGSINSEGFTLQYLIEGEGRPILVVGSALYDERVFSSDIRHNNKWIFVDHRGFGVAPAAKVDNSAFDLDVLLNDIEGVRAKLSLKDFVIVGHSGHAFLAIEYAKRFPEFVSGVVMTGCGPSNSDGRRKASAEYFERTASAERKRSFEEGMSTLMQKIEEEPEKRFVHYCLCAGAQGWYDHSFDATPLWHGLTTNMQMFDYVWGCVFRDIDITKGLDTFNKPILLALGRFDYLTGPPELWDVIKTHFKNVTEKIFEESAHCPQYEQSKEFNDVLLRWLNSINHA